MKLAIMQPYFLPYVGYFQLMASVDRFVILDDVTFMKGGWVNRNRIKSFGNIKWLTIPLTGASSNRKICEIEHSMNEKFISKTLRVVEGAYQKAPNYKDGFALCESILNTPSKTWAEFARESLLKTKNYLDLTCEIVPDPSRYNNQHLTGEERVIDICQQESAATYINATGGKAIYNCDNFRKNNIEIKFIDPQFDRYGEDFEPALSILDIIMNNSQSDAARMAHNVVLAD